MNIETYLRKAAAFQRQVDFVDSLGHFYKRVNGHFWVLKYYHSSRGEPLLVWSKVEG